MNVLVPLNNVEHLEDYIESGASEFYIGFTDPVWSETFGEYADINRMSGFKANANQNDLERLLEIIKDIKSRGKYIYVTFNSSMYSEEQLVFIERYFMRLKEAQVDGVIVSCVELVVLAKKCGIDSVVSTISGVYNSDLTKFYCEQGAKRIILPRDLSTEEIEQIIKAVPDVEYEVFMMRNGCRYSDANCLGFHRNEMMSICSCIGHANCEIYLKEENFNTKHAAELNDMIYSQSFHNYACGLCSIYRFLQLGVTACKIVGRSDEWQYVCQDIRYVRDNIEIAKRSTSEADYLEHMIFPNNSTTMCKLGLSCYYPEVRF